MSMSDETAAAVAKLQKKQKGQARWAKIGGVVLALVVVARGVDALFFEHDAPTMKSCDDSGVQQTLTDIVNKGLAKEGAQFTVKGLASFQTGAHSDAKAECTAAITLSDNSQGVVHYNVQPDQVFLEKITEN
jgi:hypothetical protein